MTEYRVTWAIDIDAESAVEAARKAREMFADPASIAHVFEVQPDGAGAPITVDLDQLDGKDI